jgi:hypothetical protein
MLCNHALDAMKTFGKFDSGRQRGMLIDYDGLPGVIPRVALPLFGVKEVPGEWIRSMETETKFYSKSRKGKQNSFSGDSEDKDKRATDEIRAAAEAILVPTFEKMTQYAKKSVLAAAPSSEVSASEPVSALSAQEFWSTFASFPKVATVRNSAAISEVDRAVWSTFANNHSSVPYEACTYGDYSSIIELIFCFLCRKWIAR